MADTKVEDLDTETVGTETMVTNQARFAVDGTLTAAGDFEVLAITAGEGNGWQFSEECLRESVALWDGAECFMDHSWFGGHSIRDLAGVIHGAAYDAVQKGIRGKMRLMGPSAPLLRELSKEMLAEGAARDASERGDSEHTAPLPRVGFSADVVFTAQGRKVNKILRVQSVDLVFNPARGGAFLRALNSVQAAAMPATNMPAYIPKGVFSMADGNESTQTHPAGSSTVQAQMSQDAAGRSSDLNAVRQLLDVQREQVRMVEEARQVRAEMCGYLLESGLAAAKLPAAMVARVRKQFSGRVFEPSELTEAIDDARKLTAELTAGQVIAGPGRVSAMFNSEDKLQAAVDDLFGVARSKELQGVQTARLSGIRELYLMLTGDDDMHGGYRADRVRLATTSDFTGLVKNALNKIVVNRWEELGRAGYDWWQKIVTVEHCTSLNQVTGILVGTVGSLPTVAEGGEYTELAIGDSPEVGSFTKYGGYIPLTLELIDRDETRKLREYPKQLAAAGLRNISSQIAGIFTSNSGAGPTMADSGALFNSTAVTTKGGHANLLTVALAAAQWDVVSAAVYNQPMLTKQDVGYYGVGPKMGINPRYLLVPRALTLTGNKILYPQWENTANIHSENQQQGQAGDVITVPEWTDATDWAAVCDPRVAPAIFVGERFGLMPEIFISGDNLSPAVFTNDESRLKVRHFLATWVADYRPMHKENVGG
jgi:hypothetical protein